jgi:hypothetical protein
MCDYSRMRIPAILLLGLALGCSDKATVVGTATGLKFDANIPNIAAGATIPTFTVSVVDPIGTVVTSATTSITILGTQNSTAITVNGTLTRAAVNGVATFTGLSIANAGSGYQLVASGPGLAAASSNTFTVGSAGVSSRSP